MEFQELVEKRQSVRSYTGKPVTEETLKTILASAAQAPSWKNTQTGRSYCVVSPELVEKFRAEVLPGFNQNSTQGVGAYIVTTYKKNISGFDKATGNPDNELGNQWGAYDLGLRDMLICLKATEMGLGTLIMGLRDADQVAKMLEIPETEQVVSIIGIGYPDKLTAKPPRKDVELVAKFL